MFVAIERQGQRWTVKADALTAPGHVAADTVNDTIRAAVLRLVHNREICSDSLAGPVYFVLYDVEDEDRARELAAALHAALHGDLEPLTRAVPTVSRPRRRGH